MTHRKKLIEVALPLEAINEASVREGYIYKGNPSSMHKWWAQRPLAAARAVIFASLVDDPLDPEAPEDFVEACRDLPFKLKGEQNAPRDRLFRFIESLVQWENSTNQEILQLAKKLIYLSTENDVPALLDPFAGGSTIPIEAQRLGLKTFASDLNPVAVVLNKALIEIPSKFADSKPVNPLSQKGLDVWKGSAGLATDVSFYGQWMRDRAWSQIGEQYPKGPNGETILAWLWCRTVKCPNPVCGAEMPLVSTFHLSTKDKGKAYIKPVINTADKTVQFRVYTNKEQPPKPPKLGRGANFRCLVCDGIAPSEYIKDQGKQKKLGEKLLATVTISKSGRHYYSPDSFNEDTAKKTQPRWIPYGELVDDPRAFTCKLYGFENFSDLFTTRQLLAMNVLCDLIEEVKQKIHADALVAGLNQDDTALADGGSGARAYAEAISTYLAFACDKYAMYGNSFVTWYTKEDRPSMLFTRQAIPMVWDFTEINPFSDVGGSFIRSVKIVTESLEQLSFDAPATVYHSSASEALVANNVVISTDPPYYDNVPYADLSDFFYVWLRHSLKDIFPLLFRTVLSPKREEIVAAPYRHGGDKAAEEYFVGEIQKAFTRIKEACNENYPVTVYYAFKEAEIGSSGKGLADVLLASTGWETMLNGLLDAGFQITGTWPIRTERAGRMRDTGSNALASSVILVCRSRSSHAPNTSRRDFVNALRRELPAALREMQSGNIAPVDLAQASIGPGMAVYSRYSQVLEPNGDRLTVRAALQLINQVLDEYLAEAEGEMDGDSRFAIAWFEQYAFNPGEFGVADVLARAKNTATAGLVDAGVIEAGAGKVRLLTWEEMDPGWDPTADKRPTVWEAVHHLIERLNTHGESGAALLLAKMPGELAANARQLAYRLYAICERKGWADHARDYNALVISWSGAQEQAAQVKQSYQQQKLF